ncbi:MAG: glycoside hydrolase family 127 protein, partial [Bacteroidales bacterium]|nr:glycoside hydrolase family 127 protein [Bacteroidales bacterium]
HELYGEYAQDHKPIVDQEEAVGHSVRAGYLYSGVADVAALTGDEDYVHAIDRIWENVVSKKLYLTGGIGASRHGEAFSQNYDLPNATAYTETCAAIANMMWNHRLFLLKGESKYMDVFERILYNGFLAGISMEGNTFFYPNPLEFDGKYAFNQGAPGRSPWFNCSCCPVNIVRTIPSIPGYIYGIRNREVFINLFINSKTGLEIKGKSFEIEQTTNYPWDGKVSFTISALQKFTATIKVRIPGWAGNQVIHSNLYSYKNEIEENIKIRINGEEADYPLENGYLVVRRKWGNGDVIELDIPMPVRKVLSNNKVEEDRNKLALERGPLVYCAEGIDNKGKVFNLLLEKETEFDSEYDPDLLNGVTIIKGKSRVTGNLKQ